MIPRDYTAKARRIEAALEAAGHTGVSVSWTEAGWWGRSDQMPSTPLGRNVTEAIQAIRRRYTLVPVLIPARRKGARSA